MFTELQIQKFALINEKIRAEEIKARAYLIKRCAVLDSQVKKGQLDDYEIETHFSVFSDDEGFCQTKEVEVGDPFYETNLYNLHPDHEDFFNLNGYINA